MAPIVVSLRSKGLPSFNIHTFLDLRYNAVLITLAVIDVFVSFILTLSNLSWSSWLSVVISIIVLSGTLATNFAQASLELMFPFYCFAVLPLLIVLCWVYWRRERALGHLAKLKAAFVPMVLGLQANDTTEQRQAAEELHKLAIAYIEDLYKYLQHKRPYARHFYMPYRANNPNPANPGSSTDLFNMSRELGLLMRKVHRGIRDMHLAASRLQATGCSDYRVGTIVRQLQQVHEATEQLINIKEMRSPVVIRAIIRWMVVVIIPVISGPYWNFLRKAMDQPAFAGIFGVLTQIALLAVFDVSMAMEDPFDETALDTISLFETLDAIGTMTSASDPSDGGGDHSVPALDDNAGRDGQAEGAHVSMLMSTSATPVQGAPQTSTWTAASQPQVSSGGAAPPQPSASDGALPGVDAAAVAKLPQMTVQVPVPVPMPPMPAVVGPVGMYGPGLMSGSQQATM